MPFQETFEEIRPNYGTRTTRVQPWKAFCDPQSALYTDRIAQAPDQKLLNVGDAALKQYALENR